MEFGVLLILTAFGLSAVGTVIAMACMVMMSQTPNKEQKQAWETRRNTIFSKLIPFAALLFWGGVAYHIVG